MNHIEEHKKLARLGAVWGTLCYVFIALAIFPGPMSPAPWYRPYFAFVGAVLIGLPPLAAIWYWAWEEITGWERIKRLYGEKI